MLKRDTNFCLLYASHNQKASNLPAWYKGGGEYSGTERLPTAKWPRRAEVVNVKI